MSEPASVALITGSSGGLGTAVMRIFAEAGWKLAGVARSGGPEIIPADLTRQEGARFAVDEALARFGRLDAVVHLMGGFAAGGRVEETDGGLWHRMLDMNLNAAFYVAREALPHLRRSGAGRMLFVGARVGLEPEAGLGAYAVSKAALIALAKTIAAENRETGLTSNLVLPSIIDTPANRKAMPEADFSRWVAPESIARLLLWLASPEGAEVSGAAIPIYGRS